MAIHQGDDSLALLADVNASEEAFAITVHPVLRLNCGGCHGVSQSPQFAVTYATAAHSVVLSFNLVNFTNPESSLVVQQVRNGHQNFPQSVGDSLRDQIVNWVSLMSGSSGGGISLPPNDPPPPLGPTFKSISANLLVPRCLPCHGVTQAKGGIRYDTYANTLRTVKAGLPSDSPLYTETNSGKMPEAPYPRFDAAEMAVLQQWILEGALE